MLPVGVLPLESADPALIGGHRLRGRLGEGGMGVVYLAGQAGDFVAIKTMRAADRDDPEARGRFAAEARLARHLDCDFTPAVLGDGSEDDLPYLVTEFVEGPSLSAAVRQKGPLPKPAVLAVAIGVADALTQIHQSGIVHRDIKPGNVLLADAGPRVIDFGIASEPAAPGSLTRTGMVMGSPGWVAPERLAGGRATFASDVFCWGLLVAYAATGHHPFGPADDSGHLAERIMSLTPDLAGMDQPLRGLVAAALSKDPDRRPPADELRRSLIASREEATAPLAIAELWTPPPAHPYRATAPPKARLSTAAIVAALIAAVLLGAFLNRGSGSSEQPRVIISTTPGPVVTVTRTADPDPKAK